MGRSLATAPRSKSSRTRSPSLHRGGIRHHVRGDFQHRLAARSCSKKESWKSEAHGSATRELSWRRAAMPPRRSCEATRLFEQIDQDVRSALDSAKKPPSRTQMPPAKFPRILSSEARILTLSSSASGFPNPEKHSSVETSTAPPGEKAPTKRWPRHAGAHVVFVGARGDDDFGALAAEGLRREKIDIRHFRIHKGVPSGIALILIGGESRENVIAVAIPPTICSPRQASKRSRQSSRRATPSSPSSRFR